MDDANPRRTGVLRVALIAALPLLLVLATVVGFVLLLPTPAAAPEVESQPEVTLTPEVTEPTPAPIPDDFVFIQVGEDLVANPPEPPLDGLEQSDTILEATALGEREGNVAFGYLTSGGEVCLHLRYDAGEGREGTGQCTTVREFELYGLTVDRGAWDVHWTADGTVTWTGI